MDRISRKDLKHDRFAEEVSHSVEYVGEHKRQFELYGGAAVVLVLAIAGFWYYSNQQHLKRQEELKEALRIQDGAVGAGQTEFLKTFPTQEAKDKAAIEAFTKLATSYPSKDEGVIARYYLGVVSADQGKFQEAEKHFLQAVDRGDKNYSSLAKLALTQIYQHMNKTADAEKLLRELMSNPSMFVSKEQATISLAKLIAPTKPDEAAKLLDPLKKERAAVSRSAITASAELNKKN